MKKIISCILVLALVLSLSALISCRSDTNEPAEEEPQNTAPADTTPTETVPNSDPVETEPDTTPEDSLISAATVAAREAMIDGAGSDMQARIDGGESPMIGVIVEGMEDSNTKAQADYLVENFEARGFSCTVTSSEGDMAKIIEAIENYATMEAVLCVVWANDTDAIKDCATNAIENGTYIITCGLPEPADYQLSGGAALDWSGMARMQVDMMGFWLDGAHPNAGDNEIKVACSILSVVTPLKIMGEDMVNWANEDPRCEVAYTEDMVMSIDGGFTFAENAMTTDPDTRVFITWQDPVSWGVNNYIMSQPELDPALFATFATGENDGTQELIEASKTNESIYRGTVSHAAIYPDGADASGPLYVALGLLYDTVEAPFYAWDSLWTIDALGYNGMQLGTLDALA